MTVRMATCRELSNNLGDVTRLEEEYMNLERSVTPVALLFPWFPGPAKKRKEAATTVLFTTLNKYVDLRKSSEFPT